MRTIVDVTALRPGPSLAFSLSSLTETPVSQPQYRNTPSSMPDRSALVLTANGLNQFSATCIEFVGEST